MRKIVIFTVFFILMTFSIHQNATAEIEGEENRKKHAEEAADKLKRKIPNTQSNETTTEPEIIEEPEIKKKLGKLKKILPTEERLEEITLRMIWNYVDKQSTIDEEHNIESIQGLLRDIGRVYDPVVNKYKVATIQIEVIKYENEINLEDYWEIEKESNLEQMFDNAYLVGSPNDSTKCFFNHMANGAITICKTNEYVIQSVIFDKYQEHFMYSKSKTGLEKLELNQHEITTKIAEEILKKIQNENNLEFNFELYKILESNMEIKEKEMVQKKYENQTNKAQNKLLDIEKDKKYGIQKFSCIKDEFGLITISGQFNNDKIKKDKVSLEIMFLDHENNVILKNTANLLEIKEFETKRFLGNLKINEKFSTCTMKISN